jgi:hypothetical protein
MKVSVDSSAPRPLLRRFDARRYGKLDDFLFDKEVTMTA